MGHELVKDVGPALSWCSSICRSYLADFFFTVYRLSLSILDLKIIAKAFKKGVDDNFS